MNIDVTSWHYRLIKLFRPYESMPTNLCVYFWYLVWSILLTIMGAILALCILVAAITHLTQTAIVIGMVIGIAGLSLISGYAYDRCTKSKPGVLSAYYKSLKDKHCKVITYVVTPEEKTDDAGTP